MTPFIKAAEDVDAVRMQRLLEGVSQELRDRFLQLMTNVRSHFSLDQLEQMVAQGRTQEAIDYLERAAQQFAAQVNQAFIASGHGAADYITANMRTIVTFNQTNARAVQAMAENELRLVREIVQEQRDSIRAVITDGISRGVNPRVMARQLRGSIGLTARQTGAVNNYRALLERGSTEALTRELRDARFDSTVRSAARDGRVLSSEQVDRMVNRYEDNMLNYRAENIARSEALRSVHEGADTMYQQAYTSGTLQPDSVTRVWIATHDRRTRNSHIGMDNQETTALDPFESGYGNQLMYPGDPAAPADDTVNCRCVVAVRLNDAAAQNLTADQIAELEGEGDDVADLADVIKANGWQRRARMGFGLGR